MKLNRMIFICSVIFLAQNASGQTRNDTDTTFFSYELIHSKSAITPDDSVHGIVLILDSADIIKYRKIIMKGMFNTREIQIGPMELSTNKMIENRDGNYRIQMQEWSDYDQWTVTAETDDGTQVQLKNFLQYHLRKPKVITLRPETSDVKIYDGAMVNEEEEESTKKITNQL